MFMSFEKIITFWKRQQNLTLQASLIDLSQENKLLHNLNGASNSLSTLYVGNKQAYVNESREILFIHPKGDHLNSLMVERMQTWQRITKMFYCQKVGHMIKDCWAKIIVEVDVKQQSNVATSSKKLYVVTLLKQEAMMTLCKWI